MQYDFATYSLAKDDAYEAMTDIELDPGCHTPP